MLVIKLNYIGIHYFHIFNRKFCYHIKSLIIMSHYIWKRIVSSIVITICSSNIFQKVFWSQRFYQKGWGNLGCYRHDYVMSGPPLVLSGLPWWLCGLRHCHWLLAVLHHYLCSNPVRGMWESCHWLGVRQRFCQILWFARPLKSG